MESIKNISSHNQNNKKSYYLDEEEPIKKDDLNETTLDLTNILKTGHNERYDPPIRGKYEGTKPSQIST